MMIEAQARSARSDVYLLKGLADHLFSGNVLAAVPCNACSIASSRVALSEFSGK